jgi:hypothetical protein
MAVLKYGACARCLTTTTGTGTYALGNTPAGYLDPFTAGMASGDRSTWRCESEDGATWEHFEGVLTAGSPSTISRARIIKTSSGGTSAISWPAGTKRITNVISPDRTAFLDSNGLLPPEILPALITQLSRVNEVLIASGAGVAFSWTQVDQNSLGAVSGGGTSQMVVPAAGLYSITLVMRCAGSLAGQLRQMSIATNDIIRSAHVVNPNAVQNIVSVTFTSLLSQGDTVKAYVYHDSGADLAFGGFGQASFTLVRLG